MKTVYIYWFRHSAKNNYSFPRLDIPKDDELICFAQKFKNTKAKFVCSLTICSLNERNFNSLGEIHGNISNKIKGKNGFGYDPIFVPKNYKITFAQMNKKKKILMDHRYIAYRKIKKKINTL